jgi:hypothetical protein
VACCAERCAGGCAASCAAACTGSSARGCLSVAQLYCFYPAMRRAVRRAPRLAPRLAPSELLCSCRGHLCSTLCQYVRLRSELWSMLRSTLVERAGQRAQQRAVHPVMLPGIQLILWAGAACMQPASVADRFRGKDISYTIFTFRTNANRRLVCRNFSRIFLQLGAGQSSLESL